MAQEFLHIEDHIDQQRLVCNDASLLLRRARGEIWVAFHYRAERTAAWLNRALALMPDDPFPQPENDDV